VESTNPITRADHGAKTLGRLEALWRYPVKSMLGEPCEFLVLNARGVEGDRLFALQDTNGKFGSGKSTHRFRKIDGLFGFHAIYEGDVPVIRFPDGRTMRGDHPDIHAALSNTLGQAITLTQEAGISHLDTGPVHLVTTAALRWLRAVVPAVYADERRFRPNLLIDVPGATQVERDWPGTTLAVGNEVRLRVSAPTERCNMVANSQADLPHDAGILRCITQKADLCFGVYADVLSPGRVERGDSVTVVA
jgi:MOSC domain-containing protein